MKCHVALALAACLGLAPTAFADKFYFGTAEDAAKMSGDAANYVEGVLLREENGNYVIRVEGGEVTVAKDMVYKIEKDGLTVAALEQRESDSAQVLAEANARRQSVQAAEASARRERAETAAAQAPAAAEQEVIITVDFQGLLPNYYFRTFDPVLNRVNLTGLRVLIEEYLRDQVFEAAYRSPRAESPATGLINPQVPTLQKQAEGRRN